MGNYVIIIREDGVPQAEGHIGTDGWNVVFCGMTVPQSVMEMWDDPRNPYKGRGNVTCMDCLEEFNMGRREGSRESSNGLESVSDTQEVASDSPGTVGG